MYFGIVAQMASVPLTAIERIEVVHGPASSVYGANAFMGVINIITVNDKTDDGTSINTRLSSAVGRYQINAARFSSPLRNRGADLRLYAGGLEIGAQYLYLDTGYGLVYPADRAVANSTWPRFMYNVFMRHRNQLSDKISTKTLLRYRSDGISNDSFDLEGYNVANSSDTKLVIGETEVEPGESARLLFLSYWQTLN